MGVQGGWLREDGLGVRCAPAAGSEGIPALGGEGVIVQGEELLLL